jgi:transcriptional regulator with XRE-family HTH domain
MRASPHVPAQVGRELERIGLGIETARLRRNMSQQELADRVGVSIHTIRAVEAGKAGTAIGSYAHALWVLGLIGTLSSVADPGLDAEGLVLEGSDRRRKGGRLRHRISDDF